MGSRRTPFSAGESGVIVLFAFPSHHSAAGSNQQHGQNETGHAVASNW